MGSADVVLQDLTPKTVAGNDDLFGGGKDDGLFGGIGNDKLWGDDATEADLGGQYHGSDYLDGGANDKWRLVA